MKKLLKGVVLTGATLSVLAAGMATVSAAHNPGPNQNNQGRNGAGNGFTVTCDFSHSARVDPIVMPGMATMSHLHAFFGNTTTNENSTGASLLAGGTTCNDQNDLSAYWFPALYQDGALVEPTSLRARYSRLGGNVTAFPQGFMAVTGRTDSTARWGCNTGRQTTFSSTLSDVPTCEGGARLVAEVKFGDCWDGTNLDSADHVSHLVASTAVDGGRPECPSTHPVRVPEVTIQAQYPAAATGGAGVTLASGAASTLHADMFEAWVGTSLQTRIGTRPANNPNCPTVDPTSITDAQQIQCGNTQAPSNQNMGRGNRGPNTAVPNTVGPDTAVPNTAVPNTAVPNAAAGPAEGPRPPRNEGGRPRR